MPQLTTSEDFLLAAKHAEIAALQQLQVNCRLVGRVTELIHELQRERGLSNIYLVSDGQRYAQQRADELRSTPALPRSSSGRRLRNSVKATLSPTQPDY